MKILVTGIQGSGKTTQAKILAQKLGYCLLSSGDLSRQKALEETPEGRQFKQALEKGVYVDDEVIGSLVAERLSQADCKLGCVSDAYPRSLAQLKIFDPNFDRVFYLEVSEKTARERLLGRGREDDTKELIESRMREYYTLTKPVIDYFESVDKLVRVDGEGSEEEVAGRLEACLAKDDAGGPRP